jgi:hypothetical protein
MTPTGSALEVSTANMPWAQAQPIWDASSKNFTDGASGVAHVFVNREGESRQYLGDHRAARVVDNPNVSDIIFHLIGGWR